MNIFKYLGIFLILFILATGKLFAQTAHKPVVFESGKAVITLEDHLHHPYYSWPTTLLNYTVIFETEPLAEHFTLSEQSKQAIIPFQISEVERQADGIFKAVLGFMSDLPSGARKTFILPRSPSVTGFPQVRIKEGDEFITIQTDKLG